MAPVFYAGPEVLEIRAFDANAIPWSELAFPELVTDYVREFLSEYGTGRFSIHVRQESGDRRRQVKYSIGDQRGERA